MIFRLIFLLIDNRRLIALEQCNEKAFCDALSALKLFSAGALPRTPWEELMMLPQTP